VPVPDQTKSGSAPAGTPGGSVAAPLAEVGVVLVRLRFGQQRERRCAAIAQSQRLTGEFALLIGEHVEDVASALLGILEGDELVHDAVAVATGPRDRIGDPRLALDESDLPVEEEALVVGVRRVDHVDVRVARGWCRHS
jgi:hypothetical protein